MTSFAFRLEPAPARGLPAAAVLLHAAAAASPWLLGVDPLPATALSAAAGFALRSTLAALPGRRHALESLAVDGTGWRARFAGTDRSVPADLGARSRAVAGFAVVDVRAGRRRAVWLLPRGSLPPAAFRRLKARLRFSC